MARVKTDFRKANKQVEKFKKQARKELQKTAKEEILGSIARGVSPVIRQGRFKAYSVLYKEQINGNAFLGEDGEYFVFRNIRGKSVPIIVDDKSDNYPSGNLGKWLRQKQVRPVNLKLSGKMLKSFFTKKGKNGIIIGFDNPLAEIHNNMGAGKSKVIRRLLPTETGETFNRSITMRFREVLNSVANKIFRR